MFQHCIWLLPEKNSNLYNLTKGFSPHISLYTHLSLSEAKQKMKTIQKKSLFVTILQKNEIDQQSGFYSYYHFVNDDIMFPQEPHISFIYDNKNIETEQTKLIYDLIDFSKQYLFDTYEIVCCQDQDFTKWYSI